MTKKYKTKQTLIDEQTVEIRFKDLGYQIRLKEQIRHSLTGLREEARKHFRHGVQLKQRSRYGKITTEIRANDASSDHSTFGMTLLIAPDILSGENKTFT
jgi:hypothetical protein